MKAGGENAIITAGGNNIDAAKVDAVKPNWPRPVLGSDQGRHGHSQGCAQWYSHGTGASASEGQRTATRKGSREGGSPSFLTQ